MIGQGVCKGRSVALLLAGTPEGRSILQDDGYRLARLIHESCLNHVIDEGSHKGES